MSARPSWLILGPGLLLAFAGIAFLAKGLYLNPHEIKSPLLEQQAPAFELPSLADGKNVRASDLVGTPTVVNFWATWCESCPRVHALLVDLARR